MYPKLGTRKPRHSRAGFPSATSTHDHHIANFSCTLVSNDSTKNYALIAQTKYLIFSCLLSLLRYPNITTPIKVKGWQSFCRKPVL